MAFVGKIGSRKKGGYLSGSARFGGTVGYTDNDLLLAERYVLEGERLVERQEAILSGLARDHHETSLAENLLRELELSLAIARRRRDQIKAELTKRTVS